MLLADLKGPMELPAERAERLAQHAFRGEVWDKAVAYCRQSGTKAIARRPCVRSWRASSRPWQAIDLRCDLRHALLILGEFRQMLAYLREAATLAEALDNQPRLGRVSAYTCRYCTAMGDHDGAVESGQHALAIAETLGNFALQVMANHPLGRENYGNEPEQQ